MASVYLVCVYRLFPQSESVLNSGVDKAIANSERRDTLLTKEF